MNSEETRLCGQIKYITAFLKKNHPTEVKSSLGGVEGREKHDQKVLHETNFN